MLFSDGQVLVAVRHLCNDWCLWLCSDRLRCWLLVVGVKLYVFIIIMAEQNFVLSLSPVWMCRSLESLLSLRPLTCKWNSGLKNLYVFTLVFLLQSRKKTFSQSNSVFLFVHCWRQGRESWFCSTSDAQLRIIRLKVKGHTLGHTSVFTECWKDEAVVSVRLVSVVTESVLSWKSLLIKHHRRRSTDTELFLHLWNVLQIRSPYRPTLCGLSLSGYFCLPE